jgi:hypothetical protein
LQQQHQHHHHQQQQQQMLTLQEAMAAVVTAAVAFKLRQANMTAAAVVGAAADGARQMQLLYSASDCDSHAPHSAYHAASCKHNKMQHNRFSAQVMQPLMASTALMTVCWCLLQVWVGGGVNFTVTRM